MTKRKSRVGIIAWLPDETTDADLARIAATGVDVVKEIPTVEEMRQILVGKVKQPHWSVTGGLGGPGVFAERSRFGFVLSVTRR